MNIEGRCVAQERQPSGSRLRLAGPRRGKFEQRNAAVRASAFFLNSMEAAYAGHRHASVSCESSAAVPDSAHGPLQSCRVSTTWGATAAWGERNVRAIGRGSSEPTDPAPSRGRQSPLICLLERG